MRKERQGQIALLILKEGMRERGVNLRRLRKKDLRQKAKVLGISTGEAHEFAEILVRELVEETFPSKKGRKKK